MRILIAFIFKPRSKAHLMILKIGLTRKEILIKQLYTMNMEIEKPNLIIKMTKVNRNTVTILNIIISILDLMEKETENILRLMSLQINKPEYE